MKIAAVATATVGAAAAISLFSLPWTVQFLVRDIPALTAATVTQPSTVVGLDGVPLATIRPVETVIPLPEGELPPLLVDAVLAMEDKRFYRHRGVDPVGLVRAMWTNLRAGGVVEGGSTITQQLVKNEVVGTNRTYERKLREALLALRVEQELTKDDIMRRYLDVFYVGGGVRGAQTAARTWFGVDATELTPGQTALIVGVLPSPNRYSPFSAPELAEQRRQLVLDRLAATGSWTQQQVVAARKENPIGDLLTQTRDATVTTEFPWVLDSVATELRRLASSVDLAAGGYLVQTGIDATLQGDAEKALQRSLTGAGMPDGAMAVIDADNGEIRAIVGGKDRTRSQVNTALGRFGGGSGRQGGSSLKPLTLATALEAGWALEDRIAAPASLPLPGREPAWNYDRRSWGRPTLRSATAWSVNTAYMNLASAVGIDRVAATGRKLGLDLDTAGPEIAIGMDEVSPVSLAAAYGAFASDGRWHTPHLVRAVVQDGVTVWKPTLETRQVLSPATVSAMSDALRAVVTDGTGGRAAIDGVEVFGKTGTTDNNADAWFAGWAGDLAAVVWVGHLEGLVPMRDVPGWGKVTGGSLPASIWQRALARTARALAPNIETNQPSRSDEAPAPTEEIPVTPTTPIEESPSPIPEPSETGQPGDGGETLPEPVPEETPSSGEVLPLGE